MAEGRLAPQSDRGCPICGGTAKTWREAQIADASEVSFTYTFSVDHMKTFQVQKCLHCGHAFCSPIPAGIERFYKDVVDEEYLRHAEVRSLSARSVLRVIRRASDGHRLLDVGCATGDLVAEAGSMGFESEGLEVSEWSSEIATQRGLRVHRASLAAFAAVRQHEFDVVTLMGVIEHFVDPIAELRHIHRLLRSNGLVVIWTGDVASITSRVLGKYWWYWQGQHIQYFTRESLTLALGIAGFEKPVVRLYPFASTFTTVSNSLRRYPMQTLLRAAAWPFYRLKRTWYLYLPGEMLAIAHAHG